MKSHERKEVNSYSASWWLLEYPQITDRSQKSLAIEQTLIYGIISTIIFHVSKYRPIFFSVNAPESVSHVNTLQHWAGRWGTRRGWWFVFVFLLSSKSEKKGGGRGGLLTLPLILHAPCQKWLVHMHACLWIAFTSDPSDVNATSETLHNDFQGPTCMKMSYFTDIFGFQCTYVSNPQKSKSWSYLVSPALSLIFPRDRMQNQRLPA